MNCSDWRRALVAVLIATGLVWPQAASADRLMNTDPRCVQLAEEVLTQPKTAGAELIEGLITCLRTETYYFENGAARAAFVAIGEPAVPAPGRGLDNKDSTIAGGSAPALGANGGKGGGPGPPLQDGVRQE